jgi:hypothetical protein
MFAFGKVKHTEYGAFCSWSWDMSVIGETWTV